MILNNRKFKSGLKKIFIALLFAFTGPVIFVIGSGNNILITITGGLCMFISFITGLYGLKEILNSFFEKTNE